MTSETRAATQQTGRPGPGAAHRMNLIRQQIEVHPLDTANIRLHGMDPYTYLVHVLQRVGQHPAARVAELTPRLWTIHFADNPLRSDLYGLPA